MFDPRPYLDRLENLCDADHVLASEVIQIASASYQQIRRLPTIISVYDDMRHIRHDHPPSWPQLARSEFIDSPAKMLISELTSAYEGALLKDDRAFTIRADYGSVIIPSLLGCRYVETGDEMPWLQHLPNIAAVKELVKSGLPDMRTGLGRKVEETEQYFLEMISPYDKLSRAVRIGCPDTQGPFNLAASIIGSDIYLTVLDNPKLVHSLLQLVTDTIIEFTKLHKNNVGEEMDKSYIMGWCTNGGIRIVDDSAVNLSGEMYHEFCVPYNTQLSEAFGGFMGHYCGLGQQLLDPMMSTSGIRVHNFGNPELQELKNVISIAREYKVGLLWDGEIHQSDKKITTGITHKRIFKTWTNAQKAATNMTIGNQR